MTCSLAGDDSQSERRGEIREMGQSVEINILNSPEQLSQSTDTD